MTNHKKLRRMTVVEIVEKDDHAVLVAAVHKGKRKTFHLRRDAVGNVDKLVSLVEAGETVQVEL